MRKKEWDGGSGIVPWDCKHFENGICNYFGDLCDDHLECNWEIEEGD